ncbi:hypothetical protein NDU88_000943 [Pleurodeles waltl]|uniref:Uncharacterized protein n=1 Tax=Pleurodeles waltl TaxID=8319 RepID=A0AAV7S6M4_PLEWA|nr:hypothetical protein NDU88_000943 [Pleurodeles waltl]
MVPLAPFQSPFAPDYQRSQRRSFSSSLDPSDCVLLPLLAPSSAHTSHPFESRRARLGDLGRELALIWSPCMAGSVQPWNDGEKTAGFHTALVGQSGDLTKAIRAWK